MVNHPNRSKEYIKPQFVRISLTASTNHLYEMENKRNEIIEKCAMEHGRILGFSKQEYWTHSLPHHLLSLLDSFDNKASEKACQAFLEFHGYTVTK